jgi:hypothetical protein
MAIPAVPVPTSPGNLSQASEPTLSSSTVTLSWNAVSGATSYEVAVKDLATNQFVVDQFVSGTSYQASLSSGGSYVWNVDAIDSAGHSNFSSPLYFLTQATSSGTIDPYRQYTYTHGTPGQPTAADVVAAAENYIGAEWGGYNCTGLVWAVSDAIGADYYETADLVASDAHESISQVRTIVPDPSDSLADATPSGFPGYVLPKFTQGEEINGQWTTFISTTSGVDKGWRYDVQIGDLVRIPAGILADGDVHSFIVVGNADADNPTDPNMWLVIDNTVQNPSGSTVQISRPHTFDNPGNVFDKDVLSASSAYVSYLTTSAPGDTTPPSLTISSTGGLTNQTTQTISGTIDAADAGLSVSIYDGTTLLGTATPAGNGNWSESVTLLSTQGAQAITAKATDAAGNVGTSNTVSYTLDTQTTDPQGNVVSQTIPNASGTQWVNAYDPENTASSMWTTSSYDANGNLTSQTGTNLDGTHWLSMYDVNNQYSWSNVTINFDAQWNRTSITGTNDNGTHTITAGSIASAYDTLQWFATPFNPNWNSTSGVSLAGDSENDTLVGGAGDDTFTAGTGNDLFYGNGGSNTFVFGPGSGKDTIADFQPTQDTIQFNPALFANYAAVLQDTTQVGANTVIQHDANSSVTLENVAANSLTANNFHFA